MDHSTSVFSTFDMDQSGKIRRLHWNERLKISEIAKSESDTSYASEDIALSKDCRRSFVWWGGEGEGGGVGWQVCSPHHTNVCKISRLWEAISSLVFNNSLSNLAILLILRRSFHVVSTNFPNLPTSKIEKKKKKKTVEGSTENLTSQQYSNYYFFFVGRAWLVILCQPRRRLLDETLHAKFGGMEKVHERPLFSFSFPWSLALCH